MFWKVFVVDIQNELKKGCESRERHRCLSTLNHDVERVTLTIITDNKGR